MAEDGVRRRLAAILAADVVGYSRLMEADQAGTLARLKALRRELFEPAAKRHGGRIFKTTGDGALVEFKSAVDAVKSAVDIQRALAAREEDLGEEHRIALRIGISLGDVLVEGSDLYGNGVNVAARMESLAEPGGICISGNVQEHLGDASDLTFEDLGEQTVKNIERPVRSYRVRLGPSDADVAAAFERPPIAVLPFDNMSSDPEQAYFADGLTEDIITGLSAWHQFPVIGRNSTFSFKGQAVTAQEVARRLGARYVLEGSVRRGGSRVRITAQLLDARTGHHVWAERYDREIEDVFALQDEITQRIVAVLVPEMERAEIERVRTKPPASLTAWDHFLQGLKFFNEVRADSIAEARTCFQRALDGDPDYARAKAYLAYTYHRELLLGSADDRDAARDSVLALAREAVAMDASDAECHWILGLAWGWNKNYRMSIAAARRALEINPLHIPAQHTLGMALFQDGRLNEALPYLERAVQFTPLDPRNANWRATLGVVHFAAGNDREACDQARLSIEAGATFPLAPWIVVAALGRLDQPEAAREAARELNLPATLPATVQRQFEDVMIFDRSATESLVEGLRRAGLLGEDG